MDKTILGSKFDKPDLERVGLFSEMPYLHGTKYIFAKPKYFNGTNILGSSLKIKTGKNDCYFEKQFKRIFNGEAVKGRGRKPKPSKFEPVSKSPFMPTGKSKVHSTPGDYYGTFQKFDHFSAEIKKTTKTKEKAKRNFLTSPGKKGSYGYNNICINTYPSHSNDRYGLNRNYKQYGKILKGPMITAHYPAAYINKNPYPDPKTMKPGKTYIKPKERQIPFIEPGWIVPTGPGKKLGGCKCGGFNKFPSYPSNKYLTSWDILEKPKPIDKVWIPQALVNKTFYTSSVINSNIEFRLNDRTLSTFKPTYTKYLLK